MESRLKIQENSALAERFEVAFNRIHHVLKTLNPHEYQDAFVKLLSISSRKHPFINSFYVDLKQFAKLRNALVHERLQTNTYIATPNEDVVLQIEKIARQLSAPPKVMKIATKTVVTLQSTHSIEYVIKTMDTSSYNQFPIYRDHEFSFLLTEGGLTSWLASNIKDGQINLTKSTANELNGFEDKHNVSFVSKNMNILELEDLFEQYFQQKKKLEAVIVTENGSRNERPLGIITPWDLIEIDLLQI
ncbi:putative transcriptional regulator [Metabacillus crassostreae]|uniref:CBS domain-containing protein n=1 Tax=Metabacillus crassostreae TaxID=929098 RepID=UPI00195C9B9F|nr:CBS domain-containing protein [Metabacillus crassostreae]MBM7606355.1 putative transcriptional regulator [Metabacillus crassostreae]